MLEASLYVSEHLPGGANGLWAIIHCATWIALGELEWVPFSVLRKSIDINLLGKRWRSNLIKSLFLEKNNVIYENIKLVDLFYMPPR